MNLKALTSDQLLSETKIIVSEERRITAKLIDHLTEINQRLLFLKLGYSSLFEFVTKELGISEGAAQRRIQTMRLMQDLPDTRQAYEEGSLSLSNAAKLQSHFQATKKLGMAKTIEEKKAIAKNAENKSQSECDQMLFKLSPELPKPERTRVLSPTVRELEFSISEELFKKVERLKELLSHSHPNATLAELIELLVTNHLTKLEKAKGLQPQNMTKPDENNLVHTAAKTLPVGIRVALPTAMKQQVWNKANGRCEYVHQGRRCSSRYQLEIDHAYPLALGGSNECSNLKLLCKNHNGFAAIEVLGLAKMSSFRK